MILWRRIFIFNEYINIIIDEPVGANLRNLIRTLQKYNFGYDPILNAVFSNYTINLFVYEFNNIIGIIKQCSFPNKYISG